MHVCIALSIFLRLQFKGTGNDASNDLVIGRGAALAA